MSVRNREEAVAAALSQVVNVPRMCQAVTRTWFLAPSVGDFDGDGAADAEDGWKSEPAAFKHPGDRKPPRGTPVSYGGGSQDNGHRAISLGPVGPNGAYMIRSTDAAGVGRVGTVPLDYPEKQWGMSYLGWSESISGIRIPEAPKPSPKPKKPNRVTKARALLKDAHTRAVEKKQYKRAAALKKALKLLPKR